MFTNPAVADFKNFFVRDFQFGVDPNNAILDQDITNAFTQVNINFNPALWADQTSYTLGYLLLSAHYLVISLRASSQGISGQYSWVQNSKAVGSVNEAFSIPQKILDNPYLAMLSKTTYGARYLELVLPLTVGNVFTAYGPTKA